MRGGQEARPVLLLTRPAAGAARFAAEARALLPGLPVVIAPLMRAVAVDHDAAALRAAPGVVLTSPEAVAACGPGAGRRALCVGPGTAAAARAAGFAVQVSPTGTADGLVGLIAASPVPLIHAHGRHVAQQLPVPGVVVYDQQPQPLTDAARGLLAGGVPVVWPLFSPRGAALAGAAAQGAQAPLRALAISAAAAAAWRDAAGRAAGDAAGLRIAARPDAEAMLALVGDACAAEQSPTKPG